MISKPATNMLATVRIIAAAGAIITAGPLLYPTHPPVVVVVITFVGWMAGAISSLVYWFSSDR